MLYLESPIYYKNSLYLKSMLNIKIILIITVFCLNFITSHAQSKITQEQKKSIESLALVKLKKFEEYISIIQNEETTFSEVNRITNRAQELFVDESAISFNIMNKNGEKEKNLKYQSVKNYLRTILFMQMLDFGKSIKWFNVSFFNVFYISDLELQPNGNYMGVITVYHKFISAKNDDLYWVDTMRKDVTIYVEKKTNHFDGQTNSYWDVLLGDIRLNDIYPSVLFESSIFHKK